MWMSRMRVALLLINPVLLGDFDHPAIFDRPAISIPRRLLITRRFRSLASSDAASPDGAPGEWGQASSAAGQRGLGQIGSVVSRRSAAWCRADPRRLLCMRLTASWI
jgi:hypothetical protein